MPGKLGVIWSFQGGGGSEVGDRQTQTGHPHFNDQPARPLSLRLFWFHTILLCNSDGRTDFFDSPSLFSWLIIFYPDYRMNALLVFFRLTEDNWGEGYRCRGVSLISGATPFIEHAGIGMEINWISIFFRGKRPIKKSGTMPDLVSLTISPLIRDNAWMRHAGKRNLICPFNRIARAKRQQRLLWNGSKGDREIIKSKLFLASCYFSFSLWWVENEETQIVRIANPRRGRNETAALFSAVSWYVGKCYLVLFYFILSFPSGSFFFLKHFWIPGRRRPWSIWQ